MFSPGKRVTTELAGFGSEDAEFWVSKIADRRLSTETRRVRIEMVRLIFRLGRSMRRHLPVAL